jgi:hypothetical protein
MTDRPDEPGGPAPGWTAPSGPADGSPGPLSSGWATDQPAPATYAAQPPPGDPSPHGWGPPSAGLPRPATPRPGVIPLRPLGVGEILDGAISTIRAKPRVMLGLSAVVAVVTQLLTVPVTWLLLHDTGDLSFSSSSSSSATADFTFTASALSASGVQLLVTLVATLLLTGVLTIVLSRAVLGQDIDAAAAWAQTRPRLPALIGVTLLVIAIELGLALVTLGPGIVLALAGAPGIAVGVVIVLGSIVMLVVGVYLYVAFTLAPVAIVLERQSVVRSLRRSRSLVRGAWWRTFGILVLVNIIAQMLSGIVAVPFSLLGVGAAWLQGGSDHLNPYTLLPLLVTAVGSILASAITWPFTAVSTALLYVDRRMRREALDIELARAAGYNPTGSSPTPGAPLDPPPPTYGPTSSYGGATPPYAG